MENLTIKTLFKKGSLALLIKIFVPGVLFLALLCAFSLQGGFHFDLLSRDPIQILDAKPYVGLLSRIGIVVWCATTGVLLFSSKLASLQDKPKNVTSFLFLTGLFTSLLMIDDFFLIHDVIFPEYLHINENLLYSFYVLSAVAILYFFRKIILDSDYVLLLLALAFFGVSVMIDVVSVLGINVPYPFIFEDGLKFLGIIGWFVYFTRISYKHVCNVNAHR